MSIANTCGIDGRMVPCQPPHASSIPDFRCGARANKVAAVDRYMGAINPYGRWPTQARFWLEWECSHVTDLVRRTELDCPHAMGIKAFSTEWSKSFRYILLLPPPSFAYHGRKPSNLRVSVGARAARLRASGLRVRSHAGACSSSAQRTTA